MNESFNRRVSSNFLWSLVSEATSKGVVFVTNIYLARVLGVSQFGVFALAQTITFYFWCAADLGLNLYGIREIAKAREQAPQVINVLLTLRAVSGAVAFLLYTLTIFLVDMPVPRKLAFIGCGLYLMTFALYTDWIYKGLERFKYIAYGSFLSSGAFLVATVSLVRSGNDLVKASFLWSLSFLLGSVSLLFLLSRSQGIRLRPDFRFDEWLLHIKSSVHFSISGILWAICRFLPVVLIGWYYTSYEVGLFSAPYRIIIALGVAGFMIPMAFYPALSEMYLRNRTAFLEINRKLRRIMFIVGLTVGIAGTVYGDVLIEMLFGDQYAKGVPVFRILVWFMALYFIRQAYGSALLSAGFERTYNLAAVAGVLFAAIAGFLLIPAQGIIGGAVSLLISEASTLCCMAVIYHFVIIRPFQAGLLAGAGANE
jgi:O-antigen/teichoic acid export membrane protein